MADHYPNPFDFVPFAEGPNLRTPEEFDALGEHLSGYLEVQIKALTPVHIVGYRDQAAQQSYMYKQGGDYCIPAASIRGSLRAFVEALTSGWVSQANLAYEKRYNERHIPFKTFGEMVYVSGQGRGPRRRRSPAAIDPAYQPSVREDGRIDVASYLFGMVIEAEENSQHAELARKAKVWFEDAFVDDVTAKNYWVPDLDGDAFFGGGKPSASTWWYLTPDEVWKRTIRRGGRVFNNAEFVGGKFWGRKFYYHQQPKGCMDHYQFKRTWVECMKENTTSSAFRIYLNHVPKPLAMLLVKALAPESTIRHKIGYGKAFGYGSVEFSILRAKLRKDDDETRIPAPLSPYDDEVMSWAKLAWVEETLAETGFPVTFIDWQGLTWLARILSWSGAEGLRYFYPPYGRNDFKESVSFADVERVFPAVVGKDRLKVTEDQGRALAKSLFARKRTIHFREYQEQSKIWPIIVKRRP